MAATPIFIATPQTWLGQLTNADTTTVKDFFTAGVNGSKIDAIGITSTDIVNRDISLYINNTTTDFLIATINVIAGQGNSGSVLAGNALLIDVMPWISQDGSLVLKANWKLRIHARATLTPASVINVFAYGGDY